ncbi:MAG: hypothetical protein NT002_10975 [candidate division Zixibacteria bacterium]|nr:hypothetical protein [candidate division Zixibacteria bacterium]
MKEQKDFLHEHRKHLLSPKPEWLQDKLKIFGMKPTELKPLNPICNVIKGPVYLDPIRKFDPHVGELDRYIRTISPKNIDELKELAGVPNRVFDKEKPCYRLPCVQMHHLPTRNIESLKELEPDERIAVKDMAHNLLFGYVDKKIVSKIPYKGVIEYMLERAKRLNTFVADTLIVCPNEVVIFRNFAAVYITNIIVYGSGCIRLGNNTKLHSYQIKHV